jgi:hypothetical protein
MPTLSRRALLSTAALLAAAPACAQAPAASSPPAASGYVPQVGQPGKDVIWLPTPQALVDRMLDMAALRKDDILVDLGSGDGRTVITAARRGTPSLGIEYNPELVVLSQRNAAEAGVGDKARFVQGDIFESDFSNATIVTLFLLPSLNLRLRPILLDMKPGTRVVSNTFDMGDWESDNKIDAGEGCKDYCRAFLWIVPAKVEGRWTFPNGQMRLVQTYQKLAGTLALNGGGVPIADGRMNGRAIRFTAGGQEYTGEVAGDIMRLSGGGRSIEARRAG